MNESIEYVLTNRVTLLAMTVVLSLLTGCASFKGVWPHQQQACYSPSSAGATKPGGTAKEPEFISPKHKSKTLRVVTYNTHLLPSIALPFAGRRSKAEYRASEIATQLAGYDLLGLCEVFDSSTRQRLLETVRSQTGDACSVAHGPSRSGTHLIGGGLLLLSRYPITDTHTITFRNRTRIVTHGFKADGFAAKGALHARLQVDDVALDCFLTHLDSQSSEIRSRQLNELGAFISQFAKSENPVVIMGDMNIPFSADHDANQSTGYGELISVLSASLDRDVFDLGSTLAEGPAGSSDAIASNGGMRIDYIFISNPESSALPQLEARPANHLRLLDSNVPDGSLSDHLAVSCDIATVSGP